MGSAFFLATPAFAQHTSEVGIGVGATNYKGEVSPQFQWQNSRPALTIFYRRDVSVPVTLRASLTTGFLRATDANVQGVNGGVPPLQSYRQLSLSGGLAEAAGVVEYNFLDYHDRRDQHRVHVSPYLFAGLGLYYVSTTVSSANDALKADFDRKGAKVGLAIPAGAGLKIALTEHFNLGLEMGARKTFTDQLDHTGDQTPLLVNSHDQDWYYYSGISLSYTFYKILCPAPYNKNKRLLK
ncbi:outer membrane beta-barrel protein [Hymenobacter sp. BRD128]|nr:outer membrane beta-barrel protein [Hymenobacter sp. BRD128]